MDLTITRKRADVIIYGAEVAVEYALRQPMPVPMDVRLMRGFATELFDLFRDSQMKAVHVKLTEQTMCSVERTFGFMIGNLRQQPELENVGNIVTAFADIYEVFHYGRRAQLQHAAQA